MSESWERVFRKDFVIMKKLDKIDRVIIDMLQKNARASLKEIAR